MLLDLFMWSTRCAFVATQKLLRLAIASCDSLTKTRSNILVGELKAKLEMITGGSHLDMKIEVYDDRSNTDSVKICDLSDDLALLGSYPVDSGMRLHVLDISGMFLVFTLLCGYSYPGNTCTFHCKVQVNC